MNNNIINILFLINNSMIIHLGKNPKNGGKPPKDNNKINIEAFINLFKLNILNVWLILNSLKLLNKKIIDNVKNVYIKKYIIQIISLLIIPLIIHPKWLIEEKAINFRKDVWLIPPKLPKTIENITIKIINDKIINGAIFCHVINKKLDHQFKPSITLGNQKWNGAVSLFNIIVEEIIIKL